MIKCTECQIEYDKTLKLCPNCGCPSEYTTKTGDNFLIEFFLEIAKNYKRVIVFDVETSGLSPLTDKIIEFGYVIYDFSVTGYLKTTNSFLIKIPNGIKLNSRTVELTGITDTELIDKGLNRELANKKIINVFSEIRSTLVFAYNAHLDVSFLRKIFEESNNLVLFNMLDFVDLMTMYKDRAKFPHKLIDAIKHYSIKTNLTSHRALRDAENSALVLECMLKEKNDALKYINLFGYNTTYAINNKLPNIKYIEQPYGVISTLYENVEREEKTKLQSINVVISDYSIRKISAFPVTYTRGCAYYEKERITTFIFNESHKAIIAQVRGEMLYSVEIYFDVNWQVENFSCNCPAIKKYNGACKHVVAVLKKYQNDVTLTITSTGKNKISIPSGYEEKSKRDFVVGQKPVISAPNVNLFPKENKISNLTLNESKIVLIKCTECNAEFDSSKELCANCGCPITYIIEQIQKDKKEKLKIQHEKDVLKENSELKELSVMQKKMQDHKETDYREQTEKKEEQERNNDISLIIGIIFLIACLIWIIIDATSFIGAFIVTLIIIFIVKIFFS